MTETTNVITLILRARDEASKAIDKNIKQVNALNKTGTVGLKNHSKAYKQVNEQVKIYGKSLAKQGVFAKKHISDIDTFLDRQTKALKRNKKGFDMNALGVMFFGMAMQRMATSIWKNTTRTFNDVMHSVEGTVTGFDKLEGSLKFLQFTAGAALEPLAEQLVPIVDWIQGIIERNPKLVEGFVKWGAIIGGLLFLIGTLKLGIVSTFNFIRDTYNGVTKAFKSISNAISGIDKEGLKTVANDFKVLGKAIGDKFMENLKWIKDNPIKGIMAAGVLTGIIMAFMWITRLKDAMGGWGEFGKNVLRGLIKGLDYLISKKIQYKRLLEELAKGKDWSEASRIAQDEFSRQMSLRIADMEEMLGKPLKGYVEDSRTLAEIWKGDLYPEVIEVQEQVSNDLAPQNVTNIDTINITPNFNETAQEAYDSFNATVRTNGF